MKKVILILCTLLIISITGCSNTQSNTTSANKDNDNADHASAAETNKPSAPSETVSPSGVSKNQSVEVSQKNNNETTSINGIISHYNVVRTSFDKNSNDIKIFFPQINGLSDKTKEAKINTLIRNIALADTKVNFSSYGYYDLNYTIMWSSNNLLSVLLEGDCYVNEAAHPNRICYSVNIDMKTGDNIRLSDIINSTFPA